MYIIDMRNDGLTVKDSHITKITPGAVSMGLPTIFLELETGYRVALKPDDVGEIVKKIQELKIW